MTQCRKRLPVRHCMGCNGAFEKTLLLRVVKNKQGLIFYDNTGKASGRGAYICRNNECLTKVVKSRRINKLFRCMIPEQVYEILQRVIGE